MDSKLSIADLAERFVFGQEPFAGLEYLRPSVTVSEFVERMNDAQRKEFLACMIELVREEFGDQINREDVRARMDRIRSEVVPPGGKPIFMGYTIEPKKREVAAAFQRALDRVEPGYRMISQAAMKRRFPRYSELRMFCKRTISGREGYIAFDLFNGRIAGLDVGFTDPEFSMAIQSYVHWSQKSFADENDMNEKLGRIVAFATGLLNVFERNDVGRRE